MSRYRNCDGEASSMPLHCLFVDHPRIMSVKIMLSTQKGASVIAQNTFSQLSYVFHFKKGSNMGPYNINILWWLLGPVKKYSFSAPRTITPMALLKCVASLPTALQVPPSSNSTVLSGYLRLLSNQRPRLVADKFH